MKKTKIQDFDPESLLDPAPTSSSDEGSEDDISDNEDVNAGREHYTAVAKSKLRQNTDAPGGPQYKGRTVNRNDVDDSDSDSDDAFAKGFDEDDIGSESGQDLEDGVNNIELNGANESGAESDADDESLEALDRDEAAQVASESPDEDDDEVFSGDEAKPDTSQVRSLMNATKSFASTLASGAQSDIAKGQAIKQQRKAFDTLLNTRIRLQKALISTNSMAADSYKGTTAPANSIAAAETAALTLLNNLTDLHVTLEEARTGQKRKRTTFDHSTSSSEMWTVISVADRSVLPHRKAILERWSTKTRATTVTNNKNRLNATTRQTLTEVLDSQLNSPHLVTRTQIPRSCAPLQSSTSSKGTQAALAVYDDADFYGLMLKEILEQRSTQSANGNAAEFVVQAPWQVAREAKTKKIVDTKASKGRRLRYTVQEKLQNFMAPEERDDWGERQRDELFGSLFGLKMVLGEQDDVGSEVENGYKDAGEAGLMLFRN